MQCHVFVNLVTSASILNLLSRGGGSLNYRSGVVATIQHFCGGNFVIPCFAAFYVTGLVTCRRIMNT